MKHFTPRIFDYLCIPDASGNFFFSALKNMRCSLANLRGKPRLVVVSITLCIPAAFSNINVFQISTTLECTLKNLWCIDPRLEISTTFASQSLPATLAFKNIVNSGMQSKNVGCNPIRVEFSITSVSQWHPALLIYFSYVNYGILSTKFGMQSYTSRILD